MRCELRYRAIHSLYQNREVTMAFICNHPLVKVYLFWLDLACPFSLALNAKNFYVNKGLNRHKSEPVMLQSKPNYLFRANVTEPRVHCVCQLSVYFRLFLSVCLSLCLSFCLCVCVCVSLSVCKT